MTFMIELSETFFRPASLTKLYLWVYKNYVDLFTLDYYLLSIEF